MLIKINCGTHLHWLRLRFDLMMMIKKLIHLERDDLLMYGWWRSFVVFTIVFPWFNDPFRFHGKCGRCVQGCVLPLIIRGPSPVAHLVFPYAKWVEYHRTTTTIVVDDTGVHKVPMSLRQPGTGGHTLQLEANHNLCAFFLLLFVVIIIALEWLARTEWPNLKQVSTWVCEKSNHSHSQKKEDNFRFRATM